MPANPKVQLTKLVVGIAGVAAVAGLAGRFAARPVLATDVASAAPETTAAPQVAPAEAPQPGFSTWFSHDDDENDDHEEREHAFGEAERHGQSSRTFQLAVPAGTQQQQPRARTRHS